MPHEPATAAPPPHIVIGTPCYGGNVTQHYMISMIRLQAACIARKIALSFRLLGGDALITRARNIIVAQFLEDPTATHLLFVDADIGFEPEQVFALLEFDRDIAGAIYPVKNLDWSAVRAQAIAGAEDLLASALSYVIEYDDPANIKAVNGFARVRYLGTGFMMIKRQVFALMAQHYPEIAFKNLQAVRDFALGEQQRHAFFDCLIDRDTGTYLSEDFTFCKRWSQIGGEIWADLRSKLTHVGRFEYRGDLMSTLSPTTMRESARRRRIPTPCHCVPTGAAEGRPEDRAPRSNLGGTEPGSSRLLRCLQHLAMTPTLSAAAAGWPAAVDRRSTGPGCRAAGASARPAGWRPPR
jgi:hypothetical protein